MHSSINDLFESNIKSLTTNDKTGKDGKDGKEDCCYHVQC
jgi:hypothetical protein